MLIDKTEIERVKRSHDLAALAEQKGVRLKRNGKQLVGLCPFHEDHEPSFIVDPKKQLWNCLGACREGGDIYKFVMKTEGLDFRQAFLRLSEGVVGSGLPVVGEDLDSSKSSALGDFKESSIAPSTAASDPTIQNPQLTTLLPTEAEWLQKTATYYRQTLLETPKAQDYLARRGLRAPELAGAFRIGYADGSFSRKIPSDSIDTLKRLGILTETGQELMKGCVVFPLLDPASGRVVSLYGRHIIKRLHLYLPGPHRGIFNAVGAKNNDEVILTESVIDACALWSIGIRNVVPVYGINGLTEEILSWLEECRIKSVLMMLDSDEPGRAAALAMSGRLKEKQLESRIIELPAKDPAEFVEQGGNAAVIRALLAEPILEVETSTATADSIQPEGGLELQPQSDGWFLIERGGREYRIRGLSAAGLDRLRVNLRLRVNGSFHLDTLDLYQARSRSAFAQAAAKQCNVPEAQVAKELLEMIEMLESARLNLPAKEETGKPAETPMTREEKEAVLKYLRSPNLLERIVEDFHSCGLIGERSSILMGYLAALSRKLTKPLSLLVVARTGAGKSSLQDAICALVPSEELVRVTRLTGQALFYKDPDSLKGKVLAIAEEEGAAQAVYSLRTLASDQWLSIAATRTDPQTGKLHTEHYEIHGPVAIIITTTSPEAFDEETRSRFVLVTMNESVEQTRAILVRQRESHTLDGVLAEAGADQVHRRHHQLQRLLRPLSVVNPYVDQLTYPADRLIARREQKKYLTLINTIALLHQYQRPVKKATRGEVAVEYIEVTPEDIRLANELAREVLWQSWDELAPPVRGMKEALEKLYQEQARKLAVDPAEVLLTRREIREATGWSDWQVRMYCQRLAEMEYLILHGNGNGRPCQYQLAQPGSEDRPHLGELAEVEALAAKRQAP
jgi:DNA primase